MSITGRRRIGLSDGSAGSFCSQPGHADFDVRIGYPQGARVDRACRPEQHDRGRAARGSADATADLRGRDFPGCLVAPAEGAAAFRPGDRAHADSGSRGQQRRAWPDRRLGRLSRGPAAPCGGWKSVRRRAARRRAARR